MRFIMMINHINIHGGTLLPFLFYCYSVNHVVSLNNHSFYILPFATDDIELIFTNEI